MRRDWQRSQALQCSERRSSTLEQRNDPSAAHGWNVFCWETLGWTSAFSNDAFRTRFVAVGERVFPSDRIKHRICRQKQCEFPEVIGTEGRTEIVG